jgi:hypothetical protein
MVGFVCGFDLSVLGDVGVMLLLVGGFNVKGLSKAGGEVRSELSANTAVLGDHVDEVEPDSVSRLFGEFNLAGHGVVTNSSCGVFKRFVGCNRVELHDKVTLDGVKYRGKVFVKKVFFSCGKPSCPICSMFGWSVREAERIESRLAEASKLFGLVEHIVCSVPVRDYGLKFECLRRKVVDVLSAHGVVGGVLIFHRDRYDRRREFGKRWFVSPHFHVLGFVLGGYGECRHCPKFKSRGEFTCAGCSGFEARARREFRKSGYIVKVLGERESVGGTAWYQLNHSSYRVGAKRSNVATWFGCCSYRKLKVTVEVRRSVCPICQQDLERLRYIGNNPEILSLYGLRRRVGVREKLDFLADGFEDGRLVWIVEVKEGWRDNG